MKLFWQRFVASLTPGVQVMLLLLVAAWLTSLLGRLLHAFDLAGWLALSGPQFWHGQVWRLVTYALAPMGVMDLVMNCVALIILGGIVERHWSRGQLWVYCLVAVAGAGLAKVLLQFSVPLPLTGAVSMVFGLLIAWGFLCGRETISLFLLGETTVRMLVLIAATAGFLISLFTGGLIPALIMVAGGVAGFGYLWLRHQWMMNRAGSVVHSERIHRLEL